MNTMEELRKFLPSEFSTSFSKNSIDQNEDLISTGIIDSLGIMKLVTFMEKNFKIKISNDDIIPENFQNLNALKAFVEKKTGQ